MKAVLSMASVAYLLIIGWFTGGVGSKVLAEREAASHWSVAPGTVVEAKVEELRAAKGGKQFRAKVRYEYDIEGNKYEGDRYAFLPLASSDAETQLAVVTRYESGSPIDVYFDPQSPEESVLDVEFAFFPWSILLWIFPLAALGVLLSLVLVSCFGPAPKAGRAARLVVVDNPDQLVVAKSRTSPLGWAALISILVPVVTCLTQSFFGQRMVLDRWTFVILGVTTALAAVVSGLTWLKGRSLEGALRIDRRRGRYAYPATAHDRELVRVQAVELRSDPAIGSEEVLTTGKHRFMLRTAASVDPLFEFDGERQVAEDLLKVLRVELCA